MNNATDLVVGVGLIIILLVVVVGGIFTISRISTEKTKRNYFECLEKVDQKTCNAIFYQFRTKDLAS